MDFPFFRTYEGRWFLERFLNFKLTDLQQVMMPRQTLKKGEFIPPETRWPDVHV